MQWHGSVGQRQVELILPYWGQAIGCMGDGNVGTLLGGVLEFYARSYQMESDR